MARDRGLDHAAILLAVGSLVLFVSLAADALSFGGSAGFGWQQLSGLALAGLLFLLGALVQVPTLIVIGLITGGVTLLADLLAFGSNKGFGWQQGVGTALGLIMVAAGFLAGRMGK